MFPSSKPEKIDKLKFKSEKLINITNKMTNFVLFFLFVGVLPFFIGFGAGLLKVFINPPSIVEEYGLGGHLLVFCTFSPIGYVVFKKTRKINLWHTTNSKKSLIQIIMVIFLPELICSLIFFIYSKIENYLSFVYEFQILIFIIFPVLSWVFLRYYLTDFENFKESFPDIDMEKLHGISIKKLINIPILLKIVLTISSLYILKSPVLLLIFDLIFLVLFIFILFFLQKKIKEKGKEKRIIFLISLIQIGIVIEGLILLSIAIYSDIFSLYLYIIAISLILYKIGFIVFFYKNKKLTQNLDSWKKSIIINDFSTVILYISSILLLFLSVSSIFPLIVILFFVFEILIESRLKVTSKMFSRVFYIFNFIVLDIAFSFFVLNKSPITETIIFTLLLVLALIILQYQKLISEKIYTFVINFIFTSLFFEIALLLSILTTNNLLLITTSMWFNYFWFISLGFLSSFYRLYVVQFKKKTNEAISSIILTLLYIVFLGIFILLERAFISLSDGIILLFNRSRILFSPSHLLEPVSIGIARFFNWIGLFNNQFPILFQSTNGMGCLLNIIISFGVIGLIFHFILVFHKKYEILTEKSQIFGKLIENIAIMIFSIVSSLLIFQSIFGIILALTLATLSVQSICTTLFNTNILIKNENDFNSISIKLFITNLVESLVCVFFFCIELLSLKITLALFISTGALIIYANFIPKISKFLKLEKHGRIVLKLINCLLFITLSILSILSTILLLENNSEYIFSENIPLTLHFSILLVLIIAIFSLIQLKDGKYLSQRHWIYCNFGILLAIITVSYSTVELLLFQIFNETNLIFKLLYIFIPLFALFFISKSLKKLKINSEIPNISLFFWIISLTFWIVSTTGICFTIALYFSFKLIFILLSVVAFGLCLVYFLGEISKIKPKIEKTISKINQYIVLIILFLIISINFDISFEYIHLSLPLSLIISIFIAILFLHKISLLKINIARKLLMEVTSILIFINSCLLVWMLLDLENIFEEISLFEIAGIFIIPLLASNYCIFLVKEKSLSKNTALSINQFLYIVLLLDIVLIVFLFLNSMATLVFSLFFTSMIITLLLLVDLYIINRLYYEKIILSGFLFSFTSNVILFSWLLSGFISEPIDIKIAFFVFFDIILLYFLLKFVSWGIDNVFSSKISNGRKIHPISSKLKNEIFSKLPDNKDKNQKITKIESKELETDKLETDKLKTDKFESDKIKFNKLKVEKTFTDNVQSFIQAQYKILIPIFDILILISSSYLVFKSIFVNSLPIYIAIFIIGSAILSAMTKYEGKSIHINFYIEYIQGILSIILYLAFIHEISIFLILLIISVIDVIATKHIPFNSIAKNFQNLFILSLYFSTFYFFGIHSSIAVGISVLLFTIFTDRKFKNLFFHSLLPWAFGYFLGFQIHLRFDISLILVIGIPLSLSFIWQWFILQKNFNIYRIHPTLKKICGYLAIFISLLTYLWCYYEYFDFFGKITPFVFLILSFILIKLKNYPDLLHRRNLYNYIVIFNCFIVIFLISNHYLFVFLENRYVLAISLAFSVSGIIYKYLFKMFEIKAEKKLIISSLALSVVSFEIFSYFFLIEPNLFHLPIEFALPISLDLSILVFFLVIGIYFDYNFKKVWDYGWYIWNIIPIINGFLIQSLIRGVDPLTDTLPILQTDIHGSLIIAIILSSFLYLPVLISKLKTHFDKIIYVFWIELCVLTIWGSENIFSDLLSIKWAFNGLISLLLLVPIFYKFKKWNYLSIIWPLLSAANILFVDLMFNLQPIWQIPLNTLIGGLYLLVLAYFPNIQRKFPKFRFIFILIGGYFTIYFSTFALLYSFIKLILIDPVISHNVTFIIMSFGLLTGKWLKLNEYIIKNILSIISILNIGCLVWRSFSIIPDINLDLFSIFIGVAFALGSALIFQARKYFPPIFKELIWFGMALFTGLSVFQLILSLINASVWIATGALFIVTGLICLPLQDVKERLYLFFTTSIAGIAMLLMGILIPASTFIEFNYIWVFLDLLLGLELLYIYFTKNSLKYAIFDNPNQNLELFSLIWVIFSASITTTIWLFNVSVFNFNLLNLILITILIFALLEIIPILQIKKYDLFSYISKIKRIIEIISTIIILILYLDSCLIIALNLPLFAVLDINLSLFAFELIYRTCILFGILFIESFIIDNYFLKLINKNIRKQLNWISFLIFSVCLFGLIQIIFENWYFSIFLLSIFSFALIRLSWVAFQKINRNLLKSINVLVLSTIIFLYMWDLLKISSSILFGEFHLILLNLFIFSSIIYCFIKFSIIDEIINLKWLSLAMFAFIAGSCEEFVRIYLSPSFLFNISVFLFLFSLLNMKKIKKPIIAYSFWLVVAFSISSFYRELMMLFEYLEFINNYSALILMIISFFYNLNTILTPPLMFFSNFGTIFTIISFILAERKIEKIGKTIIENEDRILLIGHQDQIIARKIFLISWLVETLIISLFISKIWGNIFENIIMINLEVLQIHQIFNWISLIVLVSLSMLLIGINYIKNNLLWDENERIRNNLGSLRNIFGILTYSFSLVFIFLNLLLLLLNYITIFYALVLSALISSMIIFILSSQIDLKKLHYLEENIAKKITILSLISIGASIGILWILLTGNIWIGLIIFSLFSYTLKFYSNIESKAYRILIFGLNLSLYIEILIQIGDFLFSFISEWKISLILLLILYYIFIEIENKFTFLKPYDKWIGLIRTISWGCVSTTTTLLTISYLFGGFNWIYFFLILFIYLFELFYLNYLIFGEKDEKIYSRFKNLIGILIYSEFIALITSIWIRGMKEIFSFSSSEYFIVFSCLVISILLLILISQLDMKKFHFLNENNAIKICIISLIFIGISLGSLWYLLTANILIGLIIFSLFTHTLKYYANVESKIYKMLIFLLNLSLYIEILVQLGIFLFGNFEVILSLVILLFIVHATFEIENHFIFLRPYTDWINTVRQVSWLLVSSATTILFAIYQFTKFKFSFSFLIMYILIWTMEQFYSNKIIFKDRIATKYRKIRNYIGYLVYVEIFILTYSIFKPLLAPFSYESIEFNLLILSFLISILIFVMYLLLIIDDKGIFFIRRDLRDILMNIIFPILSISISLNVGLGIFNILSFFALFSPVYIIIPIMISVLISTVFLHIILYVKYRNTILSQFFYWFAVAEIFTIFYYIEEPIILIIIGSLSFLLYMFIFFMEKILKFLQKLVQIIIEFIEDIWKNIRNFISNLIKNIIQFLKKYKRVLFITLGVCGAGVIFYLILQLNYNLLTKISICIMIFLILIIPISPEVNKEISRKVFRNTILYRTAIFLSAVGISIEFVPATIWFYPLIILVFFGAFIYGVKISEEKYNLSIMWRFVANSLFIVDLIYFLYLLFSPILF